MKTGMENEYFGLKLGQDLRNAAQPHQEFRGVPPRVRLLLGELRFPFSWCMPVSLTEKIHHS